ncbi:MAG: 30S ribosomal protein S10 [Bacteroidota bacterium]
MNQRIRIKLNAYDHRLVDKAAERIIKALKPTGTQIVGPIPLPTRKEKYSIIKSPHVNKRSAGEKFQLHTHKRLLGIGIPSIAKSHEVLDALMKIELQAGVDVNIKE